MSSSSDNRDVSSGKVAVVGAGYWGKDLVRNFADLGALAAVCDSNTDTLRALGEQYPQCRTFVSYAEVLRDEAIRAVWPLPRRPKGMLMQYERRCWPAKMCLWKSRSASLSKKEKSSSPLPKNEISFSW